jgi:nucleoside-diphosphate-sugar epimerase
VTNLVVVTGAGGFIGGHLVANLLEDGYEVRAIDCKDLSNWYQHHTEAESLVLDVSLIDEARKAAEGAKLVFNLAADMGGMGFIEANKARCMLSVLTSTNMLIASKEAGVQRYFYSSSACVYAADRQDRENVVPLAESDSYPAMPEDGYGWEKLFSERMCRHFREDFGIATRIGRYHNVYGTHGTWCGGREKAPAAICRKVAEAVLHDRPYIDIWGDGEQRRSFTYIDDCIRGTRLLTDSEFADPLNIGSSELVSINELVSLVEEIAGIHLRRRYDRSAPQGVRGRNSDNTLVRATLGWEPSVSLRYGMEITYRWVYEQVKLSQTQRKQTDSHAVDMHLQLTGTEAAAPLTPVPLLSTASDERREQR